MVGTVWDGSMVLNGRPRCCGPLTRCHCAATCCKDGRIEVDSAASRSSSCGRFASQSATGLDCLEYAASSMCLEVSGR
jgi:hypothetical protein